MMLRHILREMPPLAMFCSGLCAASARHHQVLDGCLAAAVGFTALLVIGVALAHAEWRLRSLSDRIK